MKQAVIPGGHIDALTPEEAREMLEGFFAKATEERVRAAATIVLDATGSGQDEVYLCPVGFEFEARRVSFDLSTATDPNTGAVILGTQQTPNDASNSTAVGNVALAAVLTPGVATGTQFITSFEVTGGGATAASIIQVTVTGVLGGTKTYDLVIPAGVNTSITPLIVEFPVPLQASGPNVSITVNVPAFGAGNTNAAVTAHGFWTTGSGANRSVRYLRSGTPIAWAQPEYGPAVQVPGSETWGDEQGPYVRNGEVFEVKAAGLTANAILDVTVEGIQKRLPGPQGTAS